jgi:uncharacterized protein YegP (UPF0339 family)
MTQLYDSKAKASHAIQRIYRRTGRRLKMRLVYTADAGAINYYALVDENGQGELLDETEAHENTTE